MAAKLEDIDARVSGIETAQRGSSSTNRKRTSEQTRRTGASKAAMSENAKGKGKSRASDPYDAEDDDPAEEEDEAKGTEGPGQLTPDLEAKLHRNMITYRMREHLRKLLKIELYEQLPYKQHPLTDEEVTAFMNKEPGAPVVSVANFRIDFEKSWKKFPFNRVARHVFITDFLKAIADGHYPDIQVPKNLLQPRVIGEYLDVHMEYLRPQYQLYLKKNAKQILAARTQAAGRRSRRTTVRVWLLCVTELTTAVSRRSTAA